MAKTKISEFSSTPANNTDIDSINIAEGCAPSNINDAIRELMAQLKDFQTGAVGDSFNGPMNGTIGATTAYSGAFTTVSATGVITSTLATGTAPLTIASTTKVANLNVDLLDGADWASPAALGSTTPAAVSATTLSASGTVSGTGFSNYLASPPAIGGTTAAAGSFTTLSASSTLSVTGGATFTGSVDVAGTSTAGSNIKLYEDTDNGTNYVSFKAPDTIAANVTWTLPSADGTSSQVLSTNGSGTLSWTTAGSSQWTTSGSDIYYTTGSVGIGTSTITNPLTVSKASTAVLGVFTGDNAVTGIQLNNTGTSGANIQLYASNASWSGTTNAFIVRNAAVGREIFSINSSDNAKFNGTIGVGTTPSSSGVGITFPATQSASSDANTLDDYEEGTWTPTVAAGYTSISYQNQHGWYTKVGRLVVISGRVQFSGTANGAGISIGSLPFTQGNIGGGAYGGGGIPYATVAAITNTSPYVGSSSVEFYTTGTATQITSGATNVTEKWISFVVSIST